MTSWRATEAKAQFSEVLDKAETEGPQVVQRRKKRFIVLTEEELTRRTAGVMPTTTGKTSGQILWEALRPAPQDRGDYEFPRVNWAPRKVDL
jgi:prevent-host-death family protein